RRSRRGRGRRQHFRPAVRPWWVAREVVPWPPTAIRPARQAGRLDRLLAERGDHLLHAAMALTGNELDAEDLLQAAVERLLRRRRRVDDLEAYLRRILYNLATAGWRQPAARHPRPALPPPLLNHGHAPFPDAP